MFGFLLAAFFSWPEPAPFAVCCANHCRRAPPVQLTMFARANIGGGGDRARTDDPLLAKQVLSQLSYTPGGCNAATDPTGVTQ